MQNRQDTISPVVKPSSVDSGQRIPTRRDFQALTTENINDNSLEFFPEDPDSRSVIEQKYRNPLEGNDQKRIVGLGFAFDRVLVEEGGSVDLDDLLNSLAHAAVIMERGTRKEEVLNDHIQSFLDLERCTIHRASYDNGTNSGSQSILQIATLPIKQLADTSFRNTLFDSRDIFSLRLRFDDVSGIPSSGGYVNDDLQVGSFLQIARNASVRQGQRISSV